MGDPLIYHTPLNHVACELWINAQFGCVAPSIDTYATEDNVAAISRVGTLSLGQPDQ